MRLSPTRALAWAALAVVAFTADAVASELTPTWRAPVTLGTGAVAIGDTVKSANEIAVGWQGSDGSVNVTAWTADDSGTAPVVRRLADHGSVPHLAVKPSGQMFIWWTEPTDDDAGRRVLRWTYGSQHVWSDPQTIGSPSSEPFQVIGAMDEVVEVVEPTVGDREIEATMVDSSLTPGPTRRISEGPIVGTPSAAASGIYWRQHRDGATDVMRGQATFLYQDPVTPVMVDRVPDELAGDPVTSGVGAAWPSSRDPDGHQQIKVDSLSWAPSTFTSPGTDVAAIYDASVGGNAGRVMWSTIGGGKMHMMVATRETALGINDFTVSEVLALDGAAVPVTAEPRRGQLAWSAAQANADLNLLRGEFSAQGWHFETLPGTGTPEDLRFAVLPQGQPSYAAAYVRNQGAGARHLFLTARAHYDNHLIAPVDLSGAAASVRFAIGDVLSRSGQESAYEHPVVAWQVSGGALRGTYLTPEGTPVTATISTDTADEISVTGNDQLGGVAVWRAGDTVRASLLREGALMPLAPPDPSPPSTGNQPLSTTNPILNPARAPVAKLPATPPPAAAASVKARLKGTQLRVELRCPSSSTAGCRAQIRWTTKRNRSHRTTTLAKTGLLRVAAGARLVRTLKPKHKLTAGQRTTVEALDAIGVVITRRRLTIKR